MTLRPARTLSRRLGTILLAATTTACGPRIPIETLPPLRFDTQPHSQPLETRRDLKVAFIGDQGVGGDSEAVLRLIKAEGADLVISGGDLGYRGSPETFERMVSAILGPDFPFFASLGNHDADDWRRYQQLLSARARRSGRARCEGVIGVKSACVFEGLLFINSAVGVLYGERGPDHADFIRSALARSPSRWRVCSWHFNQAVMQLGEKDDEAGWEVYEACREGGAIIATAHEHSYARTHVITRFADPPAFVAADGELQIGPGRTIAFVTGLGGHSVRPQLRGGDWWAATYTADQGARAGALFCTFHAHGRPDRAECRFKAIDGTVADRFDLLAPTPEADDDRHQNRGVAR
ncbi:MAG: metallophosphoesterase [Zoogloeaceae bacterium]|nr:metallophosphoesterase [Rhodocyclaceae bacterium]MCP5236569.1 metallophosphoesterase [Zoogloeaceae bacterium]